MRRSILARRTAWSAIAMSTFLSAMSAAPVSAQVEPDPSCTPMAHTRLRLRKLDDGIGNERLLFRGMLEIDRAIPLDIVATGMAFQMIDGTGATLLDVTLPGVAFGVDRFGWSANGTGTAWSWRDRDGEVSGFKRVVIRRGSRSADARIVLFGQEFEYPLPALPIAIRVRFPTADGTAVVCGEQIDDEEACYFRNRGNKLICR